MSFFKKIKFFKHLYNITSQKNSRPFKIKFTLTNQCNSKCLKCDYWQNKHDFSKYMTENDYAKIINSYSDNIYQLAFDGGEVFLRDDFDEILCAVLSKVKNSIDVIINTNALCELDRYLKFLELTRKFGHIRFIFFISLDGVKADNDFIRGVEGSYEKSLLIYDYLYKNKTKNLRLYFQSLVTATNYSKIPEWYQSLKKPVVFSVFHNNKFFKTDERDNGLLLDYQSHQVADFFRKLKKIYKIRDIPTFLNYLYLRRVVDVLINKKDNSCSAGFYTISIDPFGYVSQCSFSDKKIACLRDYSYDLQKLISANKTKLQSSAKNCHLKNNCLMNCEAVPSIVYDYFRKIF